MACTPPPWLNTGVRGVLLDIFGVLKDSTTSGTHVAIDGSIEAVTKLKEANFPVRFCSNESQQSQSVVVSKLHESGFTMIEPHEVFTPVPAMVNILKERNLRPYLVVHDDARESFSVLPQEDPNCVVMGDAANNFTYEAMNSAFNVLLQSPTLFSMGYGKYYKHGTSLVLDVGCFTKALEYATGVEPIIVGKPSAEYFATAVRDLECECSEVVMVGDDIVSDVGGAQGCGLRGIQVRTGKFRAGRDEPHEKVTPDGYVNNLKEFVDLLLEHNPAK